MDKFKGASQLHNANTGMQSWIGEFSAPIWILTLRKNSLYQGPVCSRDEELNTEISVIGYIRINGLFGHFFQNIEFCA